MRRCPHCQSPNPNAALFCQRCGNGLLPLKTPPFFRLADWWWPSALKASIVPLLGLLCFRFTFGNWLSVGMQRQEWHFVAFHLMHGALFGLGLAWARSEHTSKLCWRWIGLGAMGGLFAESLEYWYVYRHVIASVAFDTMNWFRYSNPTLFPFQLLQTLRLAGVVLFLWVAWIWTARPNLAQVLAAWIWVAVALFLRSQVTAGYALTWGYLDTRLAWQMTAFYGWSVLLLLYAWGLRPLDNGKA